MALSDGQGGLQKVALTCGGGAAVKAEVYLHGATLTSWMVDGQELLFVSPKALFQPPKAIRGGVPICFPQFGLLGPLKAQHGFARNMPWQLASASDSSCTLTLSSNEETLQQWPHAFHAEMTVLRVQNTGDQRLAFTTALHTYFNVSDIFNVSVVGLKGLQYWDNAAGSLMTDSSDAVHFPGEVDRAYIGAPDTLKILDSGRNAVLMLHKHGLKDAVVWNPGEGKAARMNDLGEHWRGFVCVEVAQARSGAVVLCPGEVWEGSSTVEFDTLGE